MNNAILVMESVRKEHRRGARAHHGHGSGAASEQLRPVMMITMAATLGMMPMALGTGLGAEARIGIGAASATGILVSGALTL